jgi:hypothetical protein
LITVIDLEWNFSTGMRDVSITQKGEKEGIADRGHFPICRNSSLLKSLPLKVLSAVLDKNHGFLGNSFKLVASPSSPGRHISRLANGRLLA